MKHTKKGGGPAPRRRESQKLSRKPKAAAAAAAASCKVRAVLCVASNRQMLGLPLKKKQQLGLIGTCTYELEFCAALTATSHVRSASAHTVAHTAAAVGAAFTTHAQSFPSR